MIPRLFAANAEAFNTLGIGSLTDTIVCYVDEERNGRYEGYLRYPITGIHYEDIALNKIIVCKPNFSDDPQPFRIYEISKPINGVITVSFQHISYDLAGYPTEPFTANSLTEALAGLISHCPLQRVPFTLTSSRTVSATFNATVPASIRSWLGGKQGSILDVYGGEWSYNKYTATLHTNRGQNRGVTIRYGKNLTSLEQEESCAKLYSGVYPFWTDAYGENLAQLPERIVYNSQTTKYAGATYDFDRILPLDLSDRWETKPGSDQLRAAAKSYIENNEIGTPKVNLSVSFIQESELVKDQVELCDTVTIQFERLGVSATAKCIKTRWNVLLDRYEEITLGNEKPTIAETIVSTKDTAEKAVSKSSLEIAVDQATSLITGNSGGYVVLHDSDGNGEPDEILIMNQPSIGTAQEIWRWNQSGLGYSSNGYDGPFETAITADGHIVADFMDTGTLTANIIKAGILQDEAGLNYWNMETGEISLNVSGAVDSIVTYYAESTENEAPPWDITGELFDSNGEELYGSNNQQIFAIPIWSTTVPTTATDNYRWMRNLVTYKDGTTELTSAVPMQDYYGRANLVLKMTTDSAGNPIGIMSGLADYIKFTAGQLEIDSPQFYLDREGNASFNGAVTATSLKLGEGANVGVEKIEGFDGKTEELIEGMVDATYINALKIVAGSVAAEDITGTTISGKRIEGSILYHDDGNFWNLETGEIRINAYSELFDSLESDINTAKEDISQLELGISVTNNGVTVGRQGADIKGVFSNDSLEFQTANDVPIAWFSSDANEGLGVDMVQVGSHDTTTQRWLIRTDKNGDRLMFTRRAS